MFQIAWLLVIYGGNPTVVVFSITACHASPLSAFGVRQTKCFFSAQSLRTMVRYIASLRMVILIRC